MITYAEAETALKMMEEAGNHERRKPRILAIDEWNQPVNRKQRRIKASKERRNGRNGRVSG